MSQFTIGTEEGLLTMKELAKLPEIQRARLKYSRIRQWVFVGVNGQKLPSILIGGIRYTTAERVLRFAAECCVRESIESKDICLPATIPTAADAMHKRLAEKLYGNKKGKKIQHQFEAGAES